MCLNWLSKNKKIERMGKIEIFKGNDKLFYFHIKAENGEIVSVSEGYKSKQACKDGIKSVRENINSEIFDLTKK
jgi:uncharacterized protein YegP (UPF0339 family)